MNRAAKPGAARVAPPPPRRATAPGAVRIIGGQWKRSLLPVPDRPGLRPTPDRVRETLFNWLGQDLSGWRVLDAFAGSGALGFEAASRGAAPVQLLEQDAAALAALRAAKDRLGATAVTVQRADALAWMARAPRAGLDLVLLDPPFDAGLSEAAAAAAAPLLAAGGWLALESPGAAPAPALPPALQPWRELRAGAVRLMLLRNIAP